MIKISGTTQLLLGAIDAQETRKGCEDIQQELNATCERQDASPPSWPAQEVILSLVFNREEKLRTGPELGHQIIRAPQDCRPEPGSEPRHRRNAHEGQCTRSCCNTIPRLRGSSCRHPSLTALEASSPRSRFIHPGPPEKQTPHTEMSKGKRTAGTGSWDTGTEKPGALLSTSCRLRTVRGVLSPRLRARGPRGGRGVSARSEGLRCPQQEKTDASTQGERRLTPLQHCVLF